MSVAHVPPELFREFRFRGLLFSDKQGNAARKDAGPFPSVLQDMWHSCPKVFAIVASA